MASDLIVASHDSIIPYMYKGVKWAIPNIGDNVETHNLSIARLFEKVNEHLQAFSVRTDCFVPGPPSLGAVKAHHNMYVRFNGLVNTNTKRDNMERLEAAHVTHERRAFKLYPVRYFDMKNDYCKRWTELGLQNLGNMAQLSENGWSNDWSCVTCVEMKKLVREAYRLMCVELFRVSMTDAEMIFSDDDPFFLTQEHFDNYDVSHIPSIEWVKHPALGSEFTEDEIRPITTVNIKVADGVVENTVDTDQRIREQAMQGEVVI